VSQTKDHNMKNYCLEKLKPYVSKEYSKSEL
jgi:hypothetical protein